MQSVSGSFCVQINVTDYNAIYSQQLLILLLIFILVFFEWSAICDRNIQYGTLPLPQLFNCQVLSLVYKLVYLPHLLTPIFCDYFTFSTSLYLSQAKMQFGQRSLKFKGGQLWNR